MERIAKKFYHFTPQNFSHFTPQNKLDLYSWIATIGIEIAQEHFNISAQEFYQKICSSTVRIGMRLYPHEYEGWSFEKREAYIHATAIISYLRLRKKEDLKRCGYISPLMFRLSDDKKASSEERHAASKRLDEWREEKQAKEAENKD